MASRLRPPFAPVVTVASVALASLLGTLACAPSGSGAGADGSGTDRPARGNGDAVTGLVRGLHVARGAPPLSITFDGGKPMATAITFGGVSDDVAMDEGEHAFAIAADAAAVLARSETLALDADARWSLFMWGDTSEMHASLLQAVDGDGAGFRVVHALPHAGAIHARLVTQAGGVADEDVAPGTATALSQSGDGGATLGVDVDGDGSDDASFTLARADAATDLYLVPASDGVSVSLLACTSSSGLVEIPADQAVPNARIRALHLSPNAPDVDVFVNGGAAFTGLPFQSATGFAELPPSLYDIDVAPAGAGVASSVLSVRGLELLSKKSYTAVAFGNLPGIQALALEDDFAPVSPGKIRVRAVHTADGVGTVDVLVVDPATNAGIAKLYDDVDFGTATDYVEVDAAAVRVGLDLDDDNTVEVAFDIPALPAGTVASLFAVADGAGVELLAVTQDATVAFSAVPPAPPANVRVVHLSPDAPSVAVRANGSALTSDLAFFNATDFAAVPSSSAADLDIALASSPADPILSVTGLDLAPGSFTTAVAFGRANDLRALALPEDRTPPAAGDIRVRPVHTAVGLGAVDIYAVTPQGHVKLYDDVAFGTAGDAIELPEGAYTLALDLDNDAHPDLTFTLPHLAAGTIANIFAVTDAHGNASLAVEQ